MRLPPAHPVCHAVKPDPPSRPAHVCPSDSLAPHPGGPAAGGGADCRMGSAAHPPGTGRERGCAERGRAQRTLGGACGGNYVSAQLQASYLSLGVGGEDASSG